YRLSDLVWTYCTGLRDRVANGFTAGISRDRESVFDPAVAALRRSVPGEWRFEVDGVCNAPQSADVRYGCAAHCALPCYRRAEPVSDWDLVGDCGGVLCVCLWIVVCCRKPQDNETGSVE